MKKTPAQIILETLNHVNFCIKQNSNALVGTKNGEVNPESAYIELVCDLLELAK